MINNRRIGSKKTAREREEEEVRKGGMLITKDRIWRVGVTDKGKGSVKIIKAINDYLFELKLIAK